MRTASTGASFLRASCARSRTRRIKTGELHHDQRCEPSVCSASCTSALIIAAVAALGRGVPSAQSAPPPLYGLTPIGELGGSQSAAYDISPYGGVIVGRAQTAGGAYHAFVEGYDPRTDIGTLGGTDSTAFGANSSQIVGQAQTAGGQYHAFAYAQRTRVPVDLGTLGGTWSAAYDAGGQIIVGASRIAGDARTRAFQYANGLMTPVPPPRPWR